MELLSVRKEFIIVALFDDVLLGIRLRCQERRWLIRKFGMVKSSTDDLAAAWRRMRKILGPGDLVTILTGHIERELFFQFHSLKMSSTEQRNAVAMEVSRHLLFRQDGSFQFLTQDLPESEENLVNVVFFPQNEFNNFTGKLSAAGIKVDEFISPWLAAGAFNQPLYLPKIEPDYYFSGGCWQVAAGLETKLNAIWDQWSESLSEKFVFPEDPAFSLKLYRSLLMVAMVISQGDFAQKRIMLGVLPDKNRPVRFRRHFTLTVLLLILLLLNGVWFFGRDLVANMQIYRQITAENKRLRLQTEEMKRACKKNSKEQKENARLVALRNGAPDAVAELALLSNILPGNVLVSSVRWNESEIDLLMQCENDRIDIPALIKPLYRWKVGQLNQRQMGDSAVVTINLKLIPIDEPERTP